MTVFSPVIPGWLVKFVPSTRTSTLRRSSPRRKLRDKDRLSENAVGPRIVFRPAFPYVPGRGIAKAARLKYCPGAAASIGAPVESARPLPTAPVPPVFDWLPSTRAVKGDPERAVIPPLSVQSCSSFPAVVLADRNAPFPAGEDSI